MLAMNCINVSMINDKLTLKPAVLKQQILIQIYTLTVYLRMSLQQQVMKGMVTPTFFPLVLDLVWGNAGVRSCLARPVFTDPALLGLFLMALFLDLAAFLNKRQINTIVSRKTQ